MNEKLKEKFKESIVSVLPITAIVLLVCFTVAPVSNNVMMLFLLGAIFLIFGMGFFTLGAETSMSKIGEFIGANLSKSKKVWLIALISFLVGTIVTIAEPDLQVLATQITQVPSMVLIIAVAIGVGIFLAFAMLRIVFNLSLPKILLAMYLAICVLMFFVPENFLPIAFDAGGVTTGPMTVPFIIALGIGAATIKNNKNSESDSFGLVAFCSIGPILTVMILGFLFDITETTYMSTIIPSVEDSKSLIMMFVNELPNYILEVSKALVPIIIFFVLYQVFVLKLPKKELIKVFVGLGYTFIGLVLFLTGVNVGFMPVGNQLGNELMSMDYQWLAIPIVMLMGYFIVQAEPAVVVLTEQVNEITDGAIPEKAMKIGLSIGMAVAMAIGVVRAYYGIPIMYFLLPGYLTALILMKFTPSIFTAIAFDSGGVTSGPMTATFILPFMIGICEASIRADADIMKDAFGVVAMVAMMPLIIIQVMGVAYKIKLSKSPILEDIEVQEDEEIIVFKRKMIRKEGE